VLVPIFGLRAAQRKVFPCQPQKVCWSGLACSRNERSEPRIRCRGSITGKWPRTIGPFPLNMHMLDGKSSPRIRLLDQPADADKTKKCWREPAGPF
jgi:hypothetical protein